MTTDRTDGASRSVLLGRPRFAVWLASLVGQRQLRRMQDGGLPQPLHSPFLFLLKRRLCSEDFHIVREIEGLRSAMAKRKGEFVGVFSEANGLAIPAIAKVLYP